MRLKELQIKEAATAGATASGNIAAVVNPHVANPSRKSVAYTGKPGGPSGEGPVAQYVAKKQKPTDNALDGDALLMSSKEPQMIRRQIKEGSLYEERLDELLPALAVGAGLATGVIYGAKKLGKWMKKQQDAPNRMDAAIEKATDGMYAKPKAKKKTEEGIVMPGAKGPYGDGNYAIAQLGARGKRGHPSGKYKGQDYESNKDIFQATDVERDAGAGKHKVSGTFGDPALGKPKEKAKGNYKSQTYKDVKDVFQATDVEKDAGAGKYRMPKIPKKHGDPLA